MLSCFHALSTRQPANSFFFFYIFLTFFFFLTFSLLFSFSLFLSFCSHSLCLGACQEVVCYIRIIRNLQSISHTVYTLLHGPPHPLLHLFHSSRTPPPLHVFEKTLLFPLIPPFPPFFRHDSKYFPFFACIFHLPPPPSPPPPTFRHDTTVENSQKSRLQYWVTRSSVVSFARTAHSFARSLTLLTPLLVGK